MSHRVMYIDDDDALVQVFTRMLQRLGPVVEAIYASCESVHRQLQIT